MGLTTGVGILEKIHFASAGNRITVPVLEVCELFTVPIPCPHEGRYIKKR